MVTPVFDGFCEEELNVFAPVHVYDAPETVDAFRLSVAPLQSGPLLDATGVEGIGLTVIFTLSDFEHPVAVIVSVK